MNARPRYRPQPMMSEPVATGYVGYIPNYGVNTQQMVVGERYQPQNMQQAYSSQQGPLVVAQPEMFNQQQQPQRTWDVTNQDHPEEEPECYQD